MTRRPAIAAVVLRLRAEVRSRWRTWIVIALLVGLLAGAAIATAAGARRTGSVIDRAARVEQPAHVFIVPAYTLNGDLLDYTAISRFPEVVESFRAALPGGAVNGETRSMTVVPDALLDGRRQHVITGRPPHGELEAAVTFMGRDAWGLHPGDRVTVRFARAGAELDSSTVFDGPRFTFRITGVLATLGDLGGSAEPSMVLTSAFWRAHGKDIGAAELDVYRLRRGAADYRTFHAHISKLTGGKPVFYIGNETIIEQVRRSFQLLTDGLWVLAAFLALAAALILSQVLLRAGASESSDDPTLAAMGLTPRNLFALAMARLALVLLAGAAIAAVVAYGVSPLFPLGRPRLVEPNPGASFDALAIGAGAALTVLLPLLICAIPTWRASRHRARSPRGDRRANPASILVRGLPVRPAIGAHLAIGPTTGRGAVPVRSSVATTTAGVATLVVAVVVSASLQHLLVTPRLYGWNWDVVVSGDGELDASRLASVHEVGAFSTGVTGVSSSAVVAGQQVAITAIDPDGGVAPPVLDGRLPATSNEVALGARTLRHIGVHVGDELTTRLSGGSMDATFRVVGTVVLPFTDDETALGEGMYATHAGIRRLDPEIPSDTALVRFRSGTQPAAGRAALRRAFPEAEILEAAQPLTLLDFGRVKRFPLAVALAVALLSAAAVAHVLVTAARGRRRELAILRALGLRRRDVRAAVSWQATIVVGIALALGVPAGLVAGRVLWIACANAYGFVARPVVPAVHVLLVVGAAFVLANLIAALPARTATRARPATTLRIE